MTNQYYKNLGRIAKRYMKIRQQILKLGKLANIHPNEYDEYVETKILEEQRLVLVKNTRPLVSKNMLTSEEAGYLLPTESMQLAAVKEDGLLIQFISNPSKAVQLAAVKRNMYAIEHISEPSKEARLEHAEHRYDYYPGGKKWGRDLQNVEK